MYPWQWKGLLNNQFVEIAEVKKPSNTAIFLWYYKTGKSPFRFSPILVKTPSAIMFDSSLLESAFCLKETGYRWQVPVLGGSKNDKLSALIAFSTDPTVVRD